EPDGRNRTGVDPGHFERTRDGLCAGTPPVARILLGPSGAWTGKRHVVDGGGSDDGARLVDDERARAPGADVDAEEIGHGVSGYFTPYALRHTPYAIRHTPYA